MCPQQTARHPLSADVVVENGMAVESSTFTTADDVLVEVIATRHTQLSRRTIFCSVIFILLQLSMVLASSTDSPTVHNHPTYPHPFHRPFHRLGRFARQLSTRFDRTHPKAMISKNSPQQHRLFKQNGISSEEILALGASECAQTPGQASNVILASNNYKKSGGSRSNNIITQIWHQFTSENPSRKCSVVLDNNANSSPNHHPQSSYDGINNNPWLKLWQAIPFKKLAEMGILALLFYNIFRAATEIVGEYTQELMGHAAGGFSREHVRQVIEFLECIPPDVRVKLQRAQQLQIVDESLTDSLPHLPTLSLAQKLVLAGLPLRASAPSSSVASSTPPSSTTNSLKTTGGRVSKPSVESILLSLNKAEAMILQQCLWVPSPNTSSQTTTTNWNDVVGLDRVKNGLMAQLQSILGHAKSPVYDSLFEHNSNMAGVLMYGPPGCGKSFLIKALSSQARIPCLVITPSVFLRKYVGETNQQCRTLFSLAQKLAPCILCIDEVDGLFRERSGNEHEVSRDLKTELLQYLDGMMSAAPVDPSTGRRRKNLVVAATNRPFDVDPAILRRLTQSYLVDLPDVASRAMILRHLLKRVPQDPNLDIVALSTRTEGYSPSDLRQLLQEAASMGPLRESASNPRPLTTQDVLQAMSAVAPTPLSNQYRWALSNFAQAQNPSRIQQIAVGGGASAAQGTQPQVISKWETDYGNFYHLGSLQIDSETWDQLADIAERIAEDESDYDDESDDANETD